MSHIPPTNQAGKALTSVGDGTETNNWGGVVLPTVNRTYAISGTISVPSGGTGFLPPFHVKLLYGETLHLLGVYCIVRAGTATVSIDQNGLAVAGLSAVSVSTTGAYTVASTPPAVSDGDAFSPVVTVVSAADGMEVTFVFSQSI